MKTRIISSVIIAAIAISFIAGCEPKDDSSVVIAEDEAIVETAEAAVVEEAAEVEAVIVEEPEPIAQAVVAEEPAEIVAIPAAPEPIKLITEMDKVSYAIGVRMGSSLKQGKVDANLDVLVKAVKDGFIGEDMLMTEEEIMQTINAFQRQMMEKERKAKDAQGETNLATAKKFLEDNKAKDGVTTLPSGLQYEVIEEGTGATPVATDKVKTNYRGTLIDGTEFDSSYKRGTPATFGVNRVINGWTEALQLMKEGAKWKLYIPPELAYGQRGTPNIGPNSALIFDIELIEIVKEEAPPVPTPTVPTN